LRVVWFNGNIFIKFIPFGQFLHWYLDIIHHCSLFQASLFCKFVILPSFVTSPTEALNGEEFFIITFSKLSNINFVSCRYLYYLEHLLGWYVIEDPGIHYFVMLHTEWSTSRSNVRNIVVWKTVTMDSVEIMSQNNCCGSLVGSVRFRVLEIMEWHCFPNCSMEPTDSVKTFWCSNSPPQLTFSNSLVILQCSLFPTRL
jgi:hypothetical protein